ncbi:urate hydroxylase PuuD [Salinarimonas rosea]|uniref:urate hydroxylase PuuD n=1 Tax=Salinarimonas rosea TaxID=552063 RepID=UPI00042A53B7|nr:urate hydroxylase PuuD [Salinarimonas rosea]
MIDAVTTEWASQLGRWIHVIAAVAWIGSSFYFIALDLSLRKREGLPKGVGGETWQVHGGGFYRMQKYLVAPPELPSELTWFRWESYATWLTGFFLIVWIYYVQADLYTVDPAKLALAPWQAALVGIGALALSWLVYDGLCKSPLGKNDVALGAVLFGFIIAMNVAFLQVFSDRAAFLHTGAMIATWMSASVFLVIIPNQKIVVADLKAGREPDPKLGRQAKQRSLHNNYLTLPVLFLMLGTHYPLAWTSAYAPAIVAMVIVAGALVRHFFNTMHAGKGYVWWTWGGAAAALALAAFLSVAGRPSFETVDWNAGADRPEAQTAAFQEAMLVVQGRCAMCHATEPGWPGLASAPKGVRFESPDDVIRHAGAIRAQSVLTDAMPPNNITEMTPDERRIVATWLAERDAR